MCRFLIYSGHSPILLSHLITSPTHSILTQSYDSRLRLDQTRPHNGDGFGIGYYTAAPPPSFKRRHAGSDAARDVHRRSDEREHAEDDEEPIDLGPEPCIFTSTLPAWNCPNLARLARKTTSPLIFAHVRASTEGALADSNCHPFSRGALLWMHNGGIGGWKLGVKRKLMGDIGDRWFEGVGGSTDSEWAFALFLDSLERMGVDADSEVLQRQGFGHSVLRRAMLRTIERINGFRRSLPEAVRGASDTRSLLNFAVADGKSVVCTRYVSSRTDEAASLFFSSGTSWREQQPAPGSSGSGSGKGEYRMERRDKGADIVLVASEPLTFERDNWVTVPTNSVLTIHDQTVLIHPIRDEFYNAVPSFVRSSRFAAGRGQGVGDGVVGVEVGEVCG
ncbi:glutamine amidotransferase subunit [Friedmanniomyces endolithicus]|uniref:Glutamine amidotransferase subunit n=1 Tax=Friedmanniomyces endolithicus TaxID=329885 RepID=A0AAN6QTS7_9PEZI|nr:glutamine amidotransferase subunit [Friedmanniomyces endolithicus]KAK0774738.1 glutamine amidotransferase subunit [Friedmanniomyces endolithicus]KAK0786153.1 glutamine amidotransferase subunit [Friedmanniomyces endolithicus]KAK0790110.1 glutamine amidotransferase subunit [Friedmanniomyces endolithicus]KAK0854397.1 glutamine amidotransferase subunit [Friedmanniomyces endolithicus]